jgi:hypothetical protein
MAHRRVDSDLNNHSQLTNTSYIPLSPDHAINQPPIPSSNPFNDDALSSPLNPNTLSHTQDHPQIPPIASLDPTLLANILSYLPLKDIIRVGSVCHHFYSVVSNPSLWTTLDLTPISHKVTDWWLLDFLSHPRFSNVQALNLSTCNALTDKFLSRLPDLLPHLHTLDISYCTSFDPDLVVKTGLLPNLQRFDFFYSFEPAILVHIVESILNYRRHLYGPHGDNHNDEHYFHNGNINIPKSRSMYTNRFFHQTNTTRIAISPDTFYTAYNMPGSGNDESNGRSQNIQYLPSNNPNIPPDYIDMGKSSLHYCLLSNINQLNFFNSNYTASQALLGFIHDPYRAFHEQQQTVLDMDVPEIGAAAIRRNEHEQNQGGDMEREGGDADEDIAFMPENDEEGNPFANVPDPNAIAQGNEVPKWLKTFKNICTASVMGQCFGRTKQIPVYSFNIMIDNENQVVTTNQSPKISSTSQLTHSYGHWFDLTPCRDRNDIKEFHPTTLTHNSTTNISPSSTTSPISPSHSTYIKPPTPIASKRLIIYPHAPLRLTLAGLFSECSAHRGMTSTRENVIRCLNCERLFISNNIVMDGWCIGCVAAENFAMSVPKIASVLQQYTNRRNRNGQNSVRLPFLQLPPIHANLPAEIIRNMSLIDTLEIDFEDSSGQNNPTGQSLNGDLSTFFSNRNGDIVLTLDDLNLLRQIKEGNIHAIEQYKPKLPDTQNEIGVSYGGKSNNGNNQNLCPQKLPTKPSSKIFSLNTTLENDDGRISYDPSSLDDHDLNNEVDSDVLGLLGIDEDTIGEWGLHLAQNDPKASRQNDNSSENDSTINSTDNNTHLTQSIRSDKNDTILFRQVNQNENQSEERKSNFEQLYSNLLGTTAKFQHFFQIVQKMHKLGYKRTIITTTPPLTTHQHIHSQCTIRKSVHQPEIAHSDEVHNQTANQSDQNIQRSPPGISKCQQIDPDLQYFIPTILANPVGNGNGNGLHYRSSSQHNQQPQNDQNKSTSQTLYIYGDCRGAVGPRSERLMYTTDYTIRTNPLFWVYYLVVSVLTIFLTQAFQSFNVNISNDTQLVSNSPTSYLQLDNNPFDNVIVVFFIAIGVSLAITTLIIAMVLRFQERCLSIYTSFLPFHFGLLLLASNFSLFTITCMGLSLNIDWILLLFIVFQFSVFQSMALFHKPSRIIIRKITILTISITCAASFVISLPVVGLLIGLAIFALIDLASSAAIPIITIDQQPSFLQQISTFPNIHFPISNKTALRMGEFFLVGLLVGGCYKCDVVYGILAMIVLCGAIGHGILLEPYTSGFSVSLGGGVGNNNNNNGENPLSSVENTGGMIFAKPSILLICLFFFAYCDMQTTFDITNFGINDYSKFGYPSGRTFPSLLASSVDRRYITGVIPFFLRTVASPITQEFVGFYFPQ